VQGMRDFGTAVDTTGQGRRKAKGGGILSTVRAVASLNISLWRTATSWNTAASATLHARAATSRQGSDGRAGDGRRRGVAGDGSRRPCQRMRSLAAMSTSRRGCGVQVKPSRPWWSGSRARRLISRRLIIGHRYLLQTEIAGGRTNRSRRFVICVLYLYHYIVYQ
jgi:hypothetical protein